MKVQNNAIVCLWYLCCYWWWIMLALSAQPTSGYVQPPASTWISRPLRSPSSSNVFDRYSPSSRREQKQQRRRIHLHQQPLYAISRDSTKNRHHQFLSTNQSSSDDRESDELTWLVTTTAKLIGETALPVGSLNESEIFQTLRAMREWSRRSSKQNSNAPHVVEQLLHRLIQEQQAGNAYVIIDTRTYNTVIESWSRSRQEGAAKRAEEILVGMEKQYEEGNSMVKPNRASFNNVIKSWVRNENIQDAVRKAEFLIDSMAVLSQRDADFLPPCRRGYNLLLYAYAHSRLPDAGERAESILKDMLKGGETDDAIAPDINSYTLVIKAWGQGTARGFEHRAQAIFDQVMLQMEEDIASSEKNGGRIRNNNIRPNGETYNAIIACWLKSKDNGSLTKVTCHLKKMEQLYLDEGNKDAKPDRVTMNSVMTALCRSGELERAVQLQNRMEDVYKIVPDTFSNNILIDGWSKSERTEAPERALDILMQMEEAFKGGKVHVKPDNYSYTSCIDCFVKSNRPRSGQHAMALLGRMRKLQRDFGGVGPSVDCYNAVINGLAAARNKDSADLAMSILSEMEGANTSSGDSSSVAPVPKPNRVTYNTCLKACRNGHDEYAAIAEQLLLRMSTAADHNPSLAPDSYTYAAVINVLGRSDNVDKAERVLRILNQMVLTCQPKTTAVPPSSGTSSNKKQLSTVLRPTTHVFNAALNACAFSRYDINAKMDAFVITVAILVMLQKYVTADEVTYGTVLRACSNLLPKSDPRRDDLVHKVFNKARQEGHVSDMVLTQLKFAASAPLLQELVGIDKDLEVTMDDLPKEWTRKAKRPRRRNMNRWTY